jgi:hypothetical protein
MKSDAPPKIDGDKIDINIPIKDKMKYTLEGKHSDLNVAEIFIFRIYNLCREISKNDDANLSATTNIHLQYNLHQNGDRLGLRHS